MCVRKKLIDESEERIGKILKAWWAGKKIYFYSAAGGRWIERSDNSIPLGMGVVYALEDEVNPPKTWEEMTDVERRDISFKAMSGEEIEIEAYGAWMKWDKVTPLCATRLPIRVKSNTV